MFIYILPLSTSSNDLFHIVSIDTFFQLCYFSFERVDCLHYCFKGIYVISVLFLHWCLSPTSHLECHVPTAKHDRATLCADPATQGRAGGSHTHRNSNHTVSVLNSGSPTSLSFPQFTHLEIKRITASTS